MALPYPFSFSFSFPSLFLLKIQISQSQPSTSSLSFSPLSLLSLFSEILIRRHMSSALSIFLLLFSSSFSFLPHGLSSIWELPNRRQWHMSVTCSPTPTNYITRSHCPSHVASVLELQKIVVCAASFNCSDLHHPMSYSGVHGTKWKLSASSF